MYLKLFTISELAAIVSAGAHVVRITLEGPGSLGSLAEILRHRQ